MTTSSGFAGPGEQAADRTLRRVARVAAGAGVAGGLLALALLWVALVVVEPRPRGEVIAGAAALGIGAVLWVAAQVAFTRWSAPARTGALLVTSTAAMAGAVPVAVGTVGVTGSLVLGLGLLVAMGAVVLVEVRLVPGLGAPGGDGHRVPPAVPEGSTAAVLGWLAMAGVAFAGGVGAAALGFAAVFVPVGELDWNVVVFVGGIGVAVLAAAWVLPQLAILWWLGRLGGVVRREVVIGGLVTAAVAAAWFLWLPGTELWLTVTLLSVAVALPLVELVLAAVLWVRRTTDSPQVTTPRW